MKVDFSAFVVSDTLLIVFPFEVHLQTFLILQDSVSFSKLIIIL